MDCFVQLTTTASPRPPGRSASWAASRLSFVALFGVACSTIDGKIALTDSDNDGVPDTRDCAPDDPTIRPGIDEICDGEDQDCDGEIDENAIDATEEVCDGIDNDCDGEVDEGTTDGWFLDLDGDSYGDPASPGERCDDLGSYVRNSSDCDDTDSAIHAGADEVCDELDNDCDGLVDEGLTTTFFADTDGDGHADIDAPSDFCSPPDGFLPETEADDCNDSDALIYPGAPESCDDGIDQDCDGDDTYCLIYGDLLLDPDADLTLGGVSGTPSTGSQIGFTDDVNGDGMAEIWLSSPTWDDGTVGGANAGAAHVVTLDPTFRQGLVDMALGSGAGWSVTNMKGAGKESFHGTWTSSVGDVDGDGLGDMVLGNSATNAYQIDGGAVQLVLGSSLVGGDVELSEADIRLSPGGRYWFLGTSAVTGGDVNGDGFDDVFVGAEGKVDGGGGRPGGVLVWLGCDSGIGSCQDSDGDGDLDATVEWGERGGTGSADYQLFGASGSFDRVGSAIASQFDFNADGYSDFAVGAPGALSGAGEVYLIMDFPFSTSRAWSQANLILEGVDPLDAVGSVLSAPGDLDQDGYDDVMIGVPGQDNETGAVYIMLGRGDVELSGMARQFSLADADFILRGESTGERFGASVSAGGDIDGDGNAELLVGAPSAEPNSLSLAGEVRVLRGPPAADMADAPLARISGASSGAQVGVSVASGVDLDGDGWSEILVGAPNFDGVGAGFVLFGGYHP